MLSMYNGAIAYKNKLSFDIDVFMCLRSRNSVTVVCYAYAISVLVTFIMFYAFYCWLLSMKAKGLRMSTKKQASKSTKHSATAVYKRLGIALDMVMAARPALMSEEYEFKGNEVSGPKRCSKRAA